MRGCRCLQGQIHAIRRFLAIVSNQTIRRVVIASVEFGEWGLRGRSPLPLPPNLIGLGPPLTNLKLPSKPDNDNIMANGNGEEAMVDKGEAAIQ